jgi:hypothetical protein
VLEGDVQFTGEYRSVLTEARAELVEFNRLDGCMRRGAFCESVYKQETVGR